MLRSVFKNSIKIIEKSFWKTLEAIYEYSLGEYQRWIQIWIQVTESGSVVESRQGSKDRNISSGGPTDSVLTVCGFLDQGELYDYNSVMHYLSLEYSKGLYCIDSMIVAELKYSGYYQW